MFQPSLWHDVFNAEGAIHTDIFMLRIEVGLTNTAQDIDELGIIKRLIGVDRRPSIDECLVRRPLDSIAAQV
jgi:hypothetical protein